MDQGLYLQHLNMEDRIPRSIYVMNPKDVGLDGGIGGLSGVAMKMHKAKIGDHFYIMHRNVFAGPFNCGVGSTTLGILMPFPHYSKFYFDKEECHNHKRLIKDEWKKSYHGIWWKE